MSETTPEAATATETPEAPTTETTTPNSEQQPKPAETVDYWKQKSRENEARAKSNAEVAKRLAELEDAQKTEQQRLADRQAQTERERDEARTEGLRYKAAAEYGIGKDHFDLLGVGDEEVITARAERVGSLLKENADMKAELEALRAGKTAPASDRPTAALKPGATPEAAPTGDDALYASIYGGGQQQ